ncbi:hypothetical protein Bca52824_035775 [Brassica carinata]|uniref:Uncharacterized protein n=1 Tax=Brassica carinata TaxID=52824 RepID=A0A8X7S1B8_BRACI|nr:hypothetical protein Bca52824_035775 [Brassica carinata]
MLMEPVSPPRKGDQSWKESPNREKEFRFSKMELQTQNLGDFRRSISSSLGKTSTITNRSPIRSLNVSLRLGPILDSGLISEELQTLSNRNENTDLPQLPGKMDKGKAKASSSMGQDKRTDNPKQGIVLRNRRVTKSKESPRRRIAPAVQKKGSKSSTARTKQPSTSIIPSSRRKGVNFRSDLNPIP